VKPSRQENVLPKTQAMFKAATLASLTLARQQQLKCADELQWADCLLAYTKGECGNVAKTCERTCGKCSYTDTAPICYDLIPAAHDQYYDEGSRVKSEWPNYSNTGDNSFPSKKSNTGLYPFDMSNVSTFCTDVFEKHQCDEVNLKLIYDKNKPTEMEFILTGKAYEYCRFSCGHCTQSSDCYRQHNDAMLLLSSSPKSNDDLFEQTDNFGVFDSFEFGSDFGDWGFNDDSEAETDDFSSSMQLDATEEKQVIEEEAEEGAAEDNDAGQFEWDSFGFGSFDFGSFGDWRRRRSASEQADKAAIFKAVIKDIVNKLDHSPISPKLAHRIVERYRRQAMVGQNPSTIDGELFNSLKVCWDMSNDLRQAGNEDNFNEEDYEFGEEEEEENISILDQILDRRFPTDIRGIKNYSNKKVADEVEMGDCSHKSWPYNEADNTMKLYYVCDLQCPSNHMPASYNPKDAEEPIKVINEFVMTCTRGRKYKPTQASDCIALAHPDLDIICEKHEQEEENTVAEHDEVDESAEEENNYAAYYENYLNYENFLIEY
jgi:hypothetical protein